jgi:hypothetical protein
LLAAKRKMLEEEEFNVEIESFNRRSPSYTLKSTSPTLKLGEDVEEARLPRLTSIVGLLRTESLEKEPAAETAGSSLVEDKRSTFG